MKILFKKRLLKYELAEQYDVQTGVKVDHLVRSDYLLLYQDGRMVIMKGYAWDGPSGPTIDTKNFMRGALVHDALYQLIRNGKLPEDPWRKYADDILRQICKEDGMNCIRAWYVWKSVRLFGHGSVIKPREVIVAP